MCALARPCVTEKEAAFVGWGCRQRAGSDASSVGGVRLLQRKACAAASGIVGGRERRGVGAAGAGSQVLRGHHCGALPPRASYDCALTAAIFILFL
eukprot:1107003-Rhodomonas_salina.1